MCGHWPGWPWMAIGLQVDEYEAGWGGLVIRHCTDFDIFYGTHERESRFTATFVGCIPANVFVFQKHRRVCRFQGQRRDN